MRRLFTLVLVFAVALSAFAGGEQEEQGAQEPAEEAEEEYPTKAIELVVPWPAGGRTDINARMWASVAPDYLGQPVVVVNRAGGGSVIGGQSVAEAEPDGYTLLAITPGTNVFPVIFGDAPYEATDFTAIGQIGRSVPAIVSSPDKPWSTAEELVEYAKENPGEVSYGCVSLKAQQLGFLRWAREAGAEFSFVPVGNDAEAVEGALGGQIDVGVTSSVATITSHVESGDLNALMVFSDERNENLQDTPTATELGWDVVFGPYTGIAGPPGLPEDITQKLREVHMEIVEDEDFKSVMNRAGEEILPAPGEEFADTWAETAEGYREVVEEMDLEEQE